MGTLLKIAFRNIFRNIQRSVLSTFMIFLAVIVIVMGGSYLSGMLANISEETIRVTGHMRLTTLDHDLKEKMMSLTGSITDYSKLKKAILEIPDIQDVAGQLKFSSGIYNSDGDRKQAVGYGIEPATVYKLKLKDMVYEGQMFDADSSDEAIIGREIAEDLNIDIGDKIGLSVRTLDKTSYTAYFEAVGFFDLGSSIGNRSLYVSLPDAQDVLGMKDRVTEVLLYGKSLDDTSVIKSKLDDLASSNKLQLQLWSEIGMGSLLTGIVTIVSNIVQLVMISLGALGIANTVMMAVFERRTEIGLLKSMGMHDNEIITLFTLEGMLLGLIGITAGLAVGGVGAYMLSTYGVNLGEGLNNFSLQLGGVIYGGFSPGIFIKGFAFGITATIIATLIPVLGSVHLRPGEALRR